MWSIGRALAHRNYRLFLAGQGVSLIGTWMQQVALTWLVYRLTNSPFLLGLVGFSSQIPALFIAPLAGVFTDRWNRHRALIVTQTLAMLQSLALLALVLLHERNAGWQIEVWQLIVLGTCLGFINGFDMPLRQAFLTEMVADRDHLANAIALNSSIVNGARLIGPSVAGLLIARWGEWMCFLFNTISYLAVLVALLAMRDLPVRQAKQQGQVLQGLKEGVVYAFGFRPIRAILLLLGLMSLMAMSLAVLTPVFARKILGGGADTQGFLTASSGAGALVGALYLASRRGVLGLGSRMALACVLCGSGMIAFSYSRTLWLSLALMFVTGMSTMVLLASSNTLLQTIVEEDKRGRVMSFYTMAFIGMAPIGSLLAGTIADRVGAPLAVRIAGSACILGGIVFALRLPALREQVRPIYERAGILQPIGERGASAP